MASQSSSIDDLLESRFAEWESTLKQVTDPGYASSEESLDTNNIEVFASDGRVWYREHNGRVKQLRRLEDMPGKSIHFRPAYRAHYAAPNYLETARVEALSRAIYSGCIRLTGNFSCANYIGTYPSPEAPILKADTPVPIKIQHGQHVEAITRYHEVIVAKKVVKKIHVSHIKPEYSPSDNAQLLNPQRIYFVGPFPESNSRLDIARKHYDAMQVQVHLGTSRKIKTERVGIIVLGLTNGLITTLYSDYKDGLLLDYSPGMFHTIDTLLTLYSQPVEQHVVWESDSDGRHIKIFSTENVKATWQYDTTVWLSDRDFAMDSCFDDRIIQKTARQFKNMSLESYGKMIGATIRDIVAAYQRRWKSDQRSVCGDACYLFQGDGKLAKDCIRAAPMTRGDLEGVALLSTPHGDYSLRTGEKVMYSRREKGVWHIDPEGDTASVPHLDLVGGGRHPDS